MSSITNYFLPYQILWIKDRCPLRIIQKSRQVGITYADAYDSVVKASANLGHLDVWISSRDEMQARLYLEDCKYWATFLHLNAVDLGAVILDTKNNFSAYVLQFANGRSIYCLSSNPNALAGKRGHVKLDEFALHQDQRLLYRIAKPVTTWGGTLSIISTHRGANSVFNQIIRDITENGNPMGWSLHTVPIQKAVEQGLVERINEKKSAHNHQPPPSDRPRPSDGRGIKGEGNPGEVDPSTPHSAFCTPPSGTPSTPHSAFCTPHSDETRHEFLTRIRAECLDEEQWLQEYCCQPADEASAFISFEMIHAVEADCLKGFDYLVTCENPLYLGMDIGRTKDLTVIDVGEKIRDVIWDRYRLDLANKTFTEQEYELNRLLSLPQLKRACLDRGGLGMQLSEQARERFGWKVEPVTFTAALKEEMAYLLRTAFEDRLLRIARDPDLRADLRGIKKEVTSSGNIRFAGECQDSHCDRFWAKALRQYALSKNQGGIGAMVGW